MAGGTLRAALRQAQGDTSLVMGNSPYIRHRFNSPNVPMERK
jgi:hypothetical protein